MPKQKTSGGVQDHRKLEDALKRYSEIQEKIKKFPGHKRVVMVQTAGQWRNSRTMAGFNQESN